jgi:hypothetical protein
MTFILVIRLTTVYLDVVVPEQFAQLPAGDLLCSSPPFELLDVLLPLFVEQASEVVALHVWTAYEWTSASSPVLGKA